MPLKPADSIYLPAGAVRHVQVLRKQPGDKLILFNGLAQAGEYEATIEQMGRGAVRVLIGAHHNIEREPLIQMHLAVGVPANDRMDWLVEKATELGVTSIQALMTERCVLRLSGERAEKKRLHWHAIAVAACEQCGRNQVPIIHPVKHLHHWLADWHVNANASSPPAHQLLLSLQAESSGLHQLLSNVSAQTCVFLSGPEGGLSSAEEEFAIKQGFKPISLGNRTLRAETAAIAALATLTCI